MISFRKNYNCTNFGGKKLSDDPTYLKDRFHWVHKDFGVIVEACQVGALFEALDWLVRKGAAKIVIFLF